MEELLEFTGGEIAEFCNQIVVYCNPSRVFYLGNSAGKMVEEFLQQGIAATGSFSDDNASWITAASLGQSLPDAQSVDNCDLLILEQGAVNNVAMLPADEFSSRFGTSDKILIVLFPASGELLLPFAAQWLNGLEFTRDFTAELWIEDRILTCAFDKRSPDPCLVGSYEEEWWRMALLNRKRRRLLQDYLEELIGSVFHYEHKVMELENRWESFQNSRTGKAVQWIEKVRQRLRFSR